MCWYAKKNLALGMALMTAVFHAWTNGRFIKQIEQIKAPILLEAVFAIETMSPNTI